MPNQQNPWQQFRARFVSATDTGLSADFSRAGLDDDFLLRMEKPLQHAYDGIDALEGGAIANPDEQRQVGHYWLRAPQLAPSRETQAEIRATLDAIAAFTAAVHSGQLRGEQGRKFTKLLLIGIGGSGLGPRFVADALLTADAPLTPHFIDNTDPDGIDRVLHSISGELDRTLVLVVSKSGGTAETRNGMIEVQRAYQAAAVNFAAHAVAITARGSALEQLAQLEGWLGLFPMWDWVGGRTSLCSAVGMLPLALLGIDTCAFLDGARLCDIATRQRQTRQNAAALLALSWYKLNNGAGGGQMIVLPYKDKLELLGKYLQQLVMESLGKEKDLDGNIVRQGLTVLGNKGSSDQHSYVQQLLDGPNNFLAAFVEVLREREGISPIVADSSTCGDFLQAFRLGTRQALSSRGRASLTLFLERLDARCLGALIALFERAVSIYALLTGINAYHQPAVELGKKSAGDIIALKNELLDFLREHAGAAFSAEDLAQALRPDQPAAIETIFCLLRRLSANGQYGVSVNPTEDIFAAVYKFDA